MAACNGYFCIFIVAKRKSGISRSLIKKYLITVLLPSSASTIMLMQSCFTYSRSMALFCDWANSVADLATAEVVIQAVGATIEVKVVCNVAVVLVQRARPVVAE